MKDNKNLDIFYKGDYQPINNELLSEGMDILQEVQAIQEKYNKEDTDTFINELRDSITGKTLGFNLINTEKHGFDCKWSQKRDLFLEVKSASFSAQSWAATFNDTNLDKAEAFKDRKLWLALSVWKGASDLLFICYGQHEGVGEYLEHKIRTKRPESRSTQTISLSKLVFKYDFKILTINKTKEELFNILRMKSSSFTKLDYQTHIVSLKEYVKQISTHNKKFMSIAESVQYQRL